MLNELEHLPPESARVQWALGYVWVCYTERLRAMSRHPSRPLARWVLALEMITCFLPLTLLFAAVMFSVVHAVMPWERAVLFSSGTLLGPVGLGTAVAAVCGARGRKMRFTAVVLGPLAAWTFFAYLGLILQNHTPVASWWREFVLIAVLPAFAAMHLIRVMRLEAGESTA